MIKSILSNWMTLVISALTAIVITPVLVNKLGTTYYGIWALTGAVIDYYGLLDMGMRATIFRFAARYKGIDSRRDLDETFSSAFSAALCAGALVLISLPAILWVLPGLLKLHGPVVPPFRWTLLLLALGLVLLLAGRMILTYVASLGRFDLYNLADTTTILLRTGLIYAVLELHRGIVAAAGCTLFAAIFYIMFAIRNVRAADPQLHFSFRKATWERIRELTSFSVYTSLWSLGDYLRFYTNSLVITRMLAVWLVTFYSIPGKLVAYMQTLLTGFGAPVDVEFNSLDAQDRQADLRRLYLRSTRIAAVLTLLMGLIFAFDGKSILTLWIRRQDMSLSYKVLLILLCGYVAEFAQYPNALLMVARKYQRWVGTLSVAEGLINLGLSIWWAGAFSARWGKPYGILGVALGTTVPMLLFKCCVYPAIAARLARVSLRSYFYHALGRPLIAAAMTAALVLILRNRLPSATSWGALLFTVAWQGCAAVLIFLLVGMTSEDRAYIRVRISSVLRLAGYSPAG